MADTGQAIISALHSRITTDATLLSVFDNPIDLYRVMATNDPAFPYMVHRLELGDELFHGSHWYYLDLWDYRDNPLKVDAAVNRLKRLLHAWRFSITEAAGLIEWRGGNYRQTDAPDVWRYETRWEIRFGAKQDITDIVGG